MVAACDMVRSLAGARQSPFLLELSRNAIAIHMDSRRIQNFLTVVEAGSIARASLVLHIAQPALSAQMQRLESMVGCQLLLRSSRGVSPTAAGIEFCRRARHALTAFEGLQAVGRESVAAPSGKVVVGVSPSTAQMLAVPLLGAARRQYPDIRVSLQETSSVYLGELLLRRRIDVAVLFTDQVATGMQASEVLEEDLFVVGRSVHGDEFRFAQLAGQPLVMPPRPNSIWQMLDAAASSSGMTFDVVAEISSPYTIIELVRADMGLTVLPWSMLGAAAPAELPLVRIVAPVLSRRMAVATAGATAAPVIAIRSLMVNTLKELVAGSKWLGARLM